MKIKESEKFDLYLDLARKLKGLLNMTVTSIPVVIGALGTVLKNMKKRLGELEIRKTIETIHIKAQLKSARIRRRVLVIKDYISMKKTPVSADVKKSKVAK